jgi:hypothetical protein
MSHCVTDDFWAEIPAFKGVGVNSAILCTCTMLRHEINMIPTFLGIFWGILHSQQARYSRSEFQFYAVLQLMSLWIAAHRLSCSKTLYN